MPEPDDRPRTGQPGVPVGGATGPFLAGPAASLLLRVWREGEGEDRQLKARLLSLAPHGGREPEALQADYAEGVDGIAARVRAWLLAFDDDGRL